MNEEFRNTLKSLSICDACCLRFEGCRNVKAFETTCKILQEKEITEPDVKKQKLVPCRSCLGILQSETWTDTLDSVRKEISKRCYVSETFACALSAPTCLLVREHCLKLKLAKLFPGVYDEKSVIPFKEAWKWTFGSTLSNAVGKKLDSGAVCPFMVTIHLEYSDEPKELERLPKMAPEYYSERKSQRRKYRGEDFTRKSVENVLEIVSNEDFLNEYGELPLEATDAVRCKLVECSHKPIYLAGRYNKYSRELSQTPWIVDGKRMMPLSVQDIIFKPVAEAFNIPEEKMEKCLKFMSSGREDVDVRCLGPGRPFAIEIMDPLFDKLLQEKLDSLEEEINKSDLVKVHKLAIVAREDLVHLKQGEETKRKSYQALCIKLGTKNDDCQNNRPDFKRLENGHNTSITVTKEDLFKIDSYNNCKSGSGNIVLQQKTPLRVLHRRPCLNRERIIFSMKTEGIVQGHPNLFLLNLETQAGTYIKEFIHGDFGRTTPNLVEIMGCRVDILALDVTNVFLDWPLT